MNGKNRALLLVGLALVSIGCGWMTDGVEGATWPFWSGAAFGAAIVLVAGGVK